MKLCFSKLVLLLIILPPFIAPAAQAQTFQSNPLTILISPEIPRPMETIQATAAGTDIDLVRSHISWYLNNNLITKGQGIKTLELRLGKVGVPQKIEVVVVAQDGRRYSAVKTVRPASVDVLWQSKSLIPVFYKGKSLHVQGNTVTYTAIPEFKTTAGAAINPNSLTYTWSIDGKIQHDKSGVGRQSITIVPSVIIRPYQIAAYVTTSDKSMEGFNSVLINPSSPKMLVYEDSPLYGVLLNKAVGANVGTESDEVTLVAFPYFFSSINTSENTINYSWSVKSSQKTDVLSTQSVTLRKTDTDSSAQIRVTASNPKSLFQKIEKVFKFNFDANNT